MNRYCAAVVWYKPEKETAQNILSYLNDVEIVYIVDNSDTDNRDKIKLISDQNKCKYIPLMRNYGLAYALNEACRYAIEDGYDYILTMDQDSKFENGAVRTMITYEEEHKDKYAIICPNVKSLYFDESKGQEKIAYLRWDAKSEELLNWCMTSGSLMSLKDFSKTEGFDNGMFIAHLDIDLGIKLHNSGKKIMMLGNTIICQHFGNSKPKKILWKTVHPSFASPVRTYYLFRNQKYLEKKYGKQAKNFIGVSLWKFIVKITLFESKKMDKFYMMHCGIRDAKKGKMGEWQR